VLPVYRATSFRRLIDKGGRTIPWLVLVDVDGSQAPYVVKVFDTPLIENRDSVTNEVLGNVLAKEFNLEVPSAALIEFDEEFRMTIRDPYALELLEQRDDRLKFGCQFIENCFLLHPGVLSEQELGEIPEVETIFAFDNLIRNRDRNNGKPNLLLQKKNNIILIDHELGFEVTEKTTLEITDRNWDSRFYEYHVFYAHLAAGKPADKLQYFGEFEEYLRTLNINSLSPYIQQLRNHGYKTDKQDIILNYLRTAKMNYSNFANILRSVI
jgi:hypothetical protein